MEPEAKQNTIPDGQEAAWIRAAQHGDREAFTKLIQAFEHPVYYTALSIAGNHDDASDCAQGAFERAWR